MCRMRKYTSTIMGTNNFIISDGLYSRRQGTVFFQTIADSFVFAVERNSKLHLLHSEVRQGDDCKLV